MKRRRHTKRINYAPIFWAAFVLLAAALAYAGARLLTPEGPTLEPSSSTGQPDSSSLPEPEPSSSQEPEPSQPPQSSQSQPSSSQTSASSSAAEPKPQGDWRLILVSKANRLEKELDVEMTDLRGFKVDKRIKSDFEKMLNDAAAEGIKLSIVSTYRPFARSAYLYDSKVGEYIAAGYSKEQAEKEASMWVAPPGTSEHVTGLAADIVSADYYTKLSELLPEFSTFKEAKWLKENCAEYGFILRYPEGKEDITGVYFEPWHFRYVGQEHARSIMQQGITLEEYLQQLAA